MGKISSGPMHLNFSEDVTLIAYPHSTALFKPMNMVFVLN